MFFAKIEVYFEGEKEKIDKNLLSYIIYKYFEFEIKDLKPPYLKVTGPFKGRKTYGLKISTMYRPLARTILLSLNNYYRKYIEYNNSNIKLWSIEYNNYPKNYIIEKINFNEKNVILKTITPIIFEKNIFYEIDQKRKEFEKYMKIKTTERLPIIKSFSLKNYDEKYWKGKLEFESVEQWHYPFLLYLETFGIGNKIEEGYGELGRL
ncbi:hypothetical protein [Marinitoga sp. 38H-ov]|uniref:hypothetical protein n=1 Tax=Marinitoga sp. 38H-ov TaxID=1755814 RepID=UPI0013ED898A|nr:hypothetical protein [Marinitoga sp. 38H-ov]KAF2955974.1 hypothetical protein AS160_08390 [Marinitoga sp. 38H-ov]